VAFPFAITDEHRQQVAAMVPDGRPFAVLLPGANWATKRWPAQNFAALVGPLKERFGLETVVAGGKDDVELAAGIGGINLVGRTSLAQLAALIERADLVIANDTGPMHIAAALGRPLVALFGPTNPVRTGPYKREASVVRIDIPCSPCYSRRCWHKSCLAWLAIEPVLELAAEQLGQRQRAQNRDAARLSSPKSGVAAT
jgi:heptosyltransferase I